MGQSADEDRYTFPSLILSSGQVIVQLLVPRKPWAEEDTGNVGNAGIIGTLVSN